MSNPYQGRWRWWYPAIADWMIANPGGTMTECAKALSRAPNTISMIVNTDLFKDFLAQRRRDWEQRHDFALREKTTKVAMSALDILDEALVKKRDTIPLDRLASTAFGALDRLGYSPNKPAPGIGAVNIQNNSATLVVPVNAAALREAQEAIRLSQARRAQQSALNAPPIVSESKEPLDDLSFLELAAEPEGSPASDVAETVRLPRALDDN